MIDTKLVEIVINHELEPFEHRIGGVRVVKASTDEELGRALRTVRVEVGSEDSAARLAETVKNNRRLELA